MNDSLSKDKDLLAAQVVYDYLQDHPEFFQQYPQLLANLRLPHQQRGSVSLVERQLELQREKIQALEDDITRLMSVARHNEQIFLAFNKLQAALYQARSLNEAEYSLQQFTAAMPQVSECRLICLNDEQTAAQYQLLLTRRLNADGVYLGRLNKEEQQSIFATHIHSVALLLIQNAGQPLALLAFGSEQDDHFQPSMDKLFIGHLAVILAQLLPAYDAA
ncbi:DUF484 family protein [Rheinheimera muenzenbergensis]|uniref:DUF484 family protein n=1 Tax=Rheinheimera muenzenbergensis TaxID=1193628 RepID=A0ABU8CDI1_9GAMM|nr:DUF484 family protein [Gammaproteobacteria bacterium]MBU1554857.1 DUF484 family protein [Gammaproteobacteria bacterium]MBU2070925.1 DUF484 family protein [Gammaproteobacteria bacterium]MBU2181567.1 DUF484 family protein [Gammaproteobacteria bacterium]MBU2204855.1 DUF484 family protein [Gammaproteobacteria bacterium]